MAAQIMGSQSTDPDKSAINNERLLTLKHRWGFDYDLMSLGPETHLHYDVALSSRFDTAQFDGQIDALRLAFPGRWGNYVLQLINMFFLAEELNIKRVYIRRTEVFNFVSPMKIGSIHVHDVETCRIDGSETILTGVFFASPPFGPMMDNLVQNRRRALAQTYVAKLLNESITRHNGENETDVAIHIRSGDLFEGQDGAGGGQYGGGAYAQPPLSFYLSAIERLSTHRKIHVSLVAENALNPVVLALTKALNVRKIQMTLRLNHDLSGDLKVLLNAQYLILANGTFGIACALLSKRVDYGFFFEHLSTGTHKPVEFYLGDFISKHFATPRTTYIPFGSWLNNQMQRDLMLEFPQDAIEWETPSRAVAPRSNIALNRPAMQSSFSEYSRDGESRNAVNGIKTGSFAFHTQREPHPWWQVDLEGAAEIEEIVIYNRMDVPHRALSLKVYLRDGGSWHEIHDQRGRWFGGIDGFPLRISLGGSKGDAVRIQLNGAEYLHLDQVEVLVYD